MNANRFEPNTSAAIRVIRGKGLVGLARGRTKISRRRGLGGQEKTLARADSGRSFPDSVLGPHRLARLGRLPFTERTGVRIPVGTPWKTCQSGGFFVSWRPHGDENRRLGGDRCKAPALGFDDRSEAEGEGARPCRECAAPLPVRRHSQSPWGRQRKCHHVVTCAGFLLANTVPAPPICFVRLVRDVLG